MLATAKAALQQQLLALKAHYGPDRFHLHKGTGPDAPFPVVASLDVDKPAAAAAYDVFEPLQVRVTLSSTALSTDRTEVASGLHVAVRSSELPLRLREHIAQGLEQAWRHQQQGGGAEGGLQLGPLFRRIHDEYLQLLTGLPECIEAYEASSASGATLRRFAIVQDSAPSEAGAQDGGAAAREGAGSLPPPGSAAPADCEPPAVHGLDRDVEWMRRKFGSQSCQLLPPGSGSGGGGGAPPLMRLRLEMRPTDPAWALKDGRLLLEVTVGGGYPAVGSLSVVAHPSAECSVSEEGCRLLSHVWSAEAAALAAPSGVVPPRGASPLRQLLLSIENRAGEAAKQAEQILAGRGAAPALAAAPSAADDVRSVPADDGGDSAAEGGFSWRQRVGAGLWWPCSVGSDAAAVRAAALQPAPSSGTGSSSESETESDSGSSSRASGDAGEPAGGGSQAGAAAVSHGGGGRTAVELQLAGLRCGNVDAMEVLMLNLQVVCQRCGHVDAVSLAAGEGQGRHAAVRAEAECSKCHSNWAVVLQPQHVHEASSALGLLWPSGCALQDLLPSVLQAQCAGCSASAAIRQVQVGAVSERACSHCHSGMSVQFSAVNFVPRSAAAARDRRPPRRRRPGSDGGGGGGGEAGSAELADRGACKHYRHSYRWLRFPCCGARFPCDLCHEEGSDGHHMKWATQMTCGLCSREQPLGTRCAYCHRRLSSSGGGATGEKGSHFWEGGLGCRDQSRLDRRDSHKHTNSKFKTQSKRSERVGQRGKQLREKRQAAKAD